MQWTLQISKDQHIRLRERVNLTQPIRYSARILISVICFRLPLYAKKCYEWDVVDSRSIAETDSSAIAYYFYAMEKGKELNLERLEDMGMAIRDGFVSRVYQI